MIDKDRIDQKNFRKNRKNAYIQILGGHCNICGYNKCSAALEFHHINPKEKNFSIAQGANKKLIDELEELQKCILVCANCHREIHQGLIPLEIINEKRIYNKEIEAKVLLDHSINTAPRNRYFCIFCGTEITKYSKTGLCPVCSHLQSRKVDRPNREILKKMIRFTPFTQIAKQFGVSDNAIRKWCKIENLPSKVSDIKKYTDEEWELI